MRKVLILSFLIITSNAYCQKSVWTKEYQKVVYTIFYKSNNTITNEKDRIAITNCEVDKFKLRFPDGLEKHQAEMQKAGFEIGRICEREIKAATIIKWTPQSEIVMKRAFENTKGLSEIEPIYLHRLSGCFIKKLKEVYPNGCPYPVPENVSDIISTECIKELKN